MGSVIDPPKLEKTGKCFIADCNIPRKDKNSDKVVQYLKEKYKLDIVTICIYGPLINFPV